MIIFSILFLLLISLVIVWAETTETGKKVERVVEKVERVFDNFFELIKTIIND